MAGANKTNYLLSRFNNGTATQDELRELEALLADPQTSELLHELWEKIPEDARIFEEEKSEKMLATIVERNKTAAKIITLRRNKTRALLVAATVLLVVTGSLFLRPDGPSKEAPAMTAQHKAENTGIPGTDKAVLVLDDGSTITLDNTTNGTISTQGATSVSKANGQVIYALNDTPEEATTIVYNTLKIPRGGQYQLVLADGTKVWMNASSSLHFPTAFSGSERIVELTGEAYFEVAKDASRPFSVKVNGVAVNVLGTHFNVMAYENEEAMAITLLEGAVNVTKDKDKVSLRPGQQALIKTGASLKVINNVNLDETIAWKNGYFQLDHTTLAVLMRQVERWYNVDVAYEGKIPNRQFGGKIPRKSDIKDVIKILEESKVYSRIEGNKIIILDK